MSGEASAGSSSEIVRRWWLVCVLRLPSPGWTALPARSSGGWMSTFKVAVGVVPSEAPILVLPRAAFSLCPHGVVLQACLSTSLP